MSRYWQARLSAKVVKRLRAYAKERHNLVYGYEYPRFDAIGKPGRSLTVDDLVSELLQEAGF